jgi:hypothetical protein
MASQDGVLKQDQAFLIKRTIALLCEERSVEVTFMTNRRHSDVVTCVLSGLRDLVLPLPMLILETLGHEDLELIRSRQEGLDYLLHVVVTKSLEQQSSQTPERRAKLRDH